MVRDVGTETVKVAPSVHVGVQAVEKIPNREDPSEVATQTSDTVALHAPAPLIGHDKSCQIAPHSRDAGTQNHRISTYVDPMQERGTPLSPKEATKGPLEEVTKSIRRLVEKDPLDYQVPDWVREEHDGEMETLRRVLG